MIRPRIRLPLWAAVALPAAAYVVRSIIRGWDFTPDLPGDAIAYGLLALVVAMIALARARGFDSRNEKLAAEMDDEDGASEEER